MVKLPKLAIGLLKRLKKKTDAKVFLGTVNKG